jgi:hypothetical protein
LPRTPKTRPPGAVAPGGFFGPPRWPDMSRHKYRQVRLQIISAIAGVILAAVAALLGMSFDTLKPIMPALAAAALIACFSLIAFLAGWSLYVENSQLIRKHKSIESIPQFIRFIHRRDVVTIVDAETVVYNYSVTIETKRDEACTSLLLPIEFDLGFTKKDKDDRDFYRNAVEMVYLEVDGRRKPTDATVRFRELRKVIPDSAHDIPKGVTIYGLLDIPVPLGIGYTRCKVQLEFIARKAFPKLFQREFIYIDIPYVTENMDIRIEGAKDLRVRGVEGENGEIVEAKSHFLQRIDHAETLEEKKNLHEWQTGIVWRTQYPKIGYRYVVWFQAYKDPNGK